MHSWRVARADWSCLFGQCPLMKQCTPFTSTTMMTTNRSKTAIGTCRFQGIRPCRHYRRKAVEWTMTSKCLITGGVRIIGLRDGRCLPYAMRLRAPAGRIGLDRAAPSGHWPVIAAIDFIQLPARMPPARSISV